MRPNFKKHKLIPAIVQDPRSGKVLMMAYMNEEAFDKTINSRKVTFYSRSRQLLWTKGETSKNYLELKEIRLDCDRDTLLVKAIPYGPVCHKGTDTCFNEPNLTNDSFLFTLEQIILERLQHPIEHSYTSKLFTAGKKKIAQKVGEEASEVILEGIGNSPERLKEETADLLYHTLVLLAANNISLLEVLDILRHRHERNSQKVL